MRVALPVGLRQVRTCLTELICQTAALPDLVRQGNNGFFVTACTAAWVAGLLAAILLTVGLVTRLWIGTAYLGKLTLLAASVALLAAILALAAFPIQGELSVGASAWSCIAVSVLAVIGVGLLSDDGAWQWLGRRDPGAVLLTPPRPATSAPAPTSEVGGASIEVESRWSWPEMASRSSAASSTACRSASGGRPMAIAASRSSVSHSARGEAASGLASAPAPVDAGITGPDQRA